MTLIYKKHKLNIDQPESLTPPLLSLVYERHLVDYIFSFSIEYIPLLKFVSKEWYFYCKEIQVKSNESGIYWGFRIRDPTLLPLNNLINFSDITVISAEIGNLSLLKWAKENKCPWGTTCSSAASNGHLDILKWARKNGCYWNEYTCSNAASNGHLDCLKWVRENGCPWNSHTCFSAANGGHLDCLKWARENGCPWYGDLCDRAALNGHLDCLKWAVKNGCPWDKNLCILCSRILTYDTRDHDCWYECDKCLSVFCEQCGSNCEMCGAILCYGCEKDKNYHYLECEICGNSRMSCSKCIKDKSMTCIRC